MKKAILKLTYRLKMIKKQSTTLELTLRSWKQVIDNETRKKTLKEHKIGVANNKGVGKSLK